MPSGALISRTNSQNLFVMFTQKQQVVSIHSNCSDVLEIFSGSGDSTFCESEALRGLILCALRDSDL